MPRNKHSPTQSFVPIKEVRENVIILEDGSFRAVLMVSTINIALKSEDERSALLMQFQSFLNTIDFSIQIFMESRELDIRPYLQLLEEQHKKQENELLRIQITEYIGFIKKYTENVNIMTKAFFVIIPYSPSMVGAKKSSGSSFFSKSTKEEKTEASKRSFEEHRTQLSQRVTVVEQGLRRCGLRTATLGSEEIKELFYNLFNPGEERTGVIN